MYNKIILIEGGINMKKIMNISIIVVMAIVIVMSSNLFAVGTLNTNIGSEGTAAGGVVNTANNIWATVASIVQILAVAAVVIAGVRYMFASADAKADIKKQTVILIIGAVLVFGATAILQAVINATSVIDTTESFIADKIIKL